MSTPPSTFAGKTAYTRRSAVVLFCAIFLASMAAVSAHVVRGLGSPGLATAFVSSPTPGGDVPIPIMWGTQDTRLRVVCFNVANTSPERADDPGWPRVTGVGFELPGALSGFALMAPLDGDWTLIEGADAYLSGQGPVTLDFAILARVNPVGRTPGSPEELLGIPPGQQGVRGSGTRFCVSGPFPDRLPDLSTPDAEDSVATTIEGVLNGVVVGFHRVTGSDAGTDVGVWFPPPGTAPRAIPLYP